MVSHLKSRSIGPKHREQRVIDVCPERGDGAISGTLVARVVPHALPAIDGALCLFKPLPELWPEKRVTKPARDTFAAVLERDG